MNFLKLTMIDTPSPRDADASKNKSVKFKGLLIWGRQLNPSL